MKLMCVYCATNYGCIVLHIPLLQNKTMYFTIQGAKLSFGLLFIMYY